jgi:UDP-N-acetyl-2-amino-2-deoxyglucuronate dehydrogenase
MDRKIKFAVIGCGHIGKRHAEMVERNEESELVALVDVKPKEELNIEKFDVPFFSSVNDLLQSGIEADVINIATPNGDHAAHALLCLEHKKHIVIEKPIALSRQDAERIIYKALHVHKHVFAVMQNRYSPPSVWLKEVINAGILGRIFMVQINCYWNRDARYYKKDTWHGNSQKDGGTLFTQFSHFIDIMYWLFGDITNIEGKFRDFNHADLTDFEDSGTLNFDFINGGIGILNYSTSCWETNLESSITIIAENGSIKVGGQYMNEVTYCNIKDYAMPDLAPTNPGNDYGSYKGSAANHDHVIRNVVDVIRGRDTITTNALEGLKVVDIIERMYEVRDAALKNQK